MLDREGDSRNVPVAFILFRDILFSVRSEELPVFRLQRLRARIQTGYVSDGMGMLLDLYAADVEYSADSLEEIYSALGEVGKKVLSETITDKEAAKTLADIAEGEDLNGRIRRNVLDTRRALTFLIRRKLLSVSQLEDAQQILRDIANIVRRGEVDSANACRWSGRIVEVIWREGRVVHRIPGYFALARVCAVRVAGAVDADVERRVA